MTKYLNFFESESGFTEAVEAGQLFFPNVSYTEEDDTVHWNLTQPANPVETPMLRMHFTTSTPGEGVALRHEAATTRITAMEIDGTPVNFASGGTYSIAEPGNHTAVYQFASPEIPIGLFNRPAKPFTAFTSAEITSPVTSIGYFSFGNCSGLTSVTISDSVTLIDGVSFSGCSGLTSVTIPDSVKTIAYEAFAGSGLRSVTIPDSVTSLGNRCFGYCTEMLSARIGSGATVIPFAMFFGCTSLKSVTLPDNLTVIGQNAFVDCSSLHDINIPSGVTTIDGNAFSGCSGLTAIYLNPETPPTLGGGALANTNNCPIYVPADSVETYKQAWSAYASRIKPMGGVQYSIAASINDDRIGRVRLNQETASEGDWVDFHVDVFISQYQVSNVTCRDGNGDNVEVTDEGDGDYSFTMPASDVTIFVEIGEKPGYNISASVNDDSLGVVNVQETASEGEEVDFSVYVFDSDANQITSVTATDGNGDEVRCQLVFDEGDHNRYSFTMPASNVTISATIGEKQKHTVTVNSTDDMVPAEAVEFMSDDGQPSYKEGEHVVFSFNFGDPEGVFRMASVQASDCDGNSIEVELEDEGGDRYYCSFEMPGCDVSVFITIEDTRPKYNITAAVNDSSLGEVQLEKETLPGGEIVDFHVEIFDSEANSVTSVAVTDGNGNNVECTKDYYGNNDYVFTMPASDVTVSVVIGDKIPEYNVSASLNDDSLGRVKVSRTPLPEGEYGGFHVNLNDEEQYQISSVTVTDGNGNNVEWTTYVDYTNTHYYQFKMPASDVSAFVTIEKKP